MMIEISIMMKAEVENKNDKVKSEGERVDLEVSPLAKPLSMSRKPTETNQRFNLSGSHYASLILQEWAHRKLEFGGQIHD